MTHETATPPITAENPVMAECGSRRCHVCRCKYPPFGFGFPLAKKGQTLWACCTHRVDVDRMLTRSPSTYVPTQQSKLL
jgi:hypothetical protein